MNREFELDGLKFMAFAILPNVVNYAFQIAAARTLSINDYGTLTVLMSAILVLQIPGQACQIIAAKNVSACYTNGDTNGATSIIERLLRISITISIVYLVGSVILIPAFNKVMMINSIIYTMFMLCTVIMTLGYFLTIGVAQGLRKVVTMSTMAFTNAAVKIMGVCLAWAFFSKSGHRMTIIMIFVLLGTTLGMMIGILILHKAKWLKKITTKNIFSHSGLFYKEFGISLMLNLCIVFITYIDVFLIRIHASEYMSGLYSSSAQIAKVAIFAMLPIINVFLPQLSKAKALNASTLSLYFKALTYVCALCGVGFIVILLFPEFIISALMGAKYIDAAVFIRYSYLIAFGIVLNMLNMNYLIVVEKTRLAAITYGTGAVSCLLAGVFIDMDIMRIAKMVALITVLIFAINFIYIIKTTSKESVNLNNESN